jgi:hypothetical protein
MTSERDWADQLIAAGVLVPTQQLDANGNVVYRMGEFPPGEEGLRLKVLFDQNVVQHSTGSIANDHQRRLPAANEPA